LTLHYKKKATNISQLAVFHLTENLTYLPLSHIKGRMHQFDPGSTSLGSSKLQIKSL